MHLLGRLELAERGCTLKGQATENAFSDLAVSPNAAKLSNYGQQNLMQLCRSLAKDSLTAEVMPDLLAKGIWKQQG